MFINEEILSNKFPRLLDESHNLCLACKAKVPLSLDPQWKLQKPLKGFTADACIRDKHYLPLNRAIYIPNDMHTVFALQPVNDLRQFSRCLRD